MSSEKIVFMMMTDRRIIDAKDWMKKYFNPAMLEKKKFFLNTNIGIKNIKFSSIMLHENRILFKEIPIPVLKIIPSKRDLFNDHAIDLLGGFDLG